MYSEKGIVYSDGGKYLKKKGRNVFGFAVPGIEEDFEELDVTLDDIRWRDGLIVFTDDHLAVNPPSSMKRDDIIRKIIKTRYSNDDQIATILNGRDEEMERMQGWRNFAKSVAGAIEAMEGGVSK